MSSPRPSRPLGDFGAASGGGLASGVALAAKAISPSIRGFGISMDRGVAMHESVRAGPPAEDEEVVSLADSLGGGIGLDNRLSYPLCQSLLDDIVLVSEEPPEQMIL